MLPEEFVKLLTPEATALLGEIVVDSKLDVVKTVSRLRAAGNDASTVASVLSQAKLRSRAAAKFGDFAKNMFFTEDGLEQASRLSVSAHHAGRYRDAGIRQVADLGCGIGSESMAFAALDLDVTAIELDEVTAACATYNLAPFENAKVLNADVTAIDLSGFESQFFDPARRELGTGREKATRKFDPAAFAPNYDWVLKQANERPTGIKLGPGHPHEAIPKNSEAQWVSVNGDLVELTLWFGKLARPGIARSALLIKDGEAVEIKSETFEKTLAPVRDLENFVYEPDNAVIRSHLIGELALQLELGIISPEIAYLTGNLEISSPWLRGFKVLENLNFDRKKLKARLRELNIGVLEIKKRGSDVVPEILRKELQLKGERAATLIITRVGDSHRALICEAL
ncbi:MAG: THUMP-like domain-containing protein [Micrococcales bacterium]